MCEWVLECGEYIKRVLSHFPKVPGVSGKHLGGEQNGVDQRINASGRDTERNGCRRHSIALSHFFVRSLECFYI